MQIAVSRRRNAGPKRWRRLQVSDRKVCTQNAGLAERAFGRIHGKRKTDDTLELQKKFILFLN